MPASDYRALQNQIRELQCLLGKKPLEAEIFNTVGEPVRSVQGNLKQRLHHSSP